MDGAAEQLVSVVIPAHNAARTLDETLRSVRAQTHENLEILVVDDGSTDRTADIAAAHAAQDPRVRLIRQDNSGVAAARNRGVTEARGELIAPIDADDLWRPEKIERQLQVLRMAGESVALVYTWFASINAEGRVTDKRPRPSVDGDVLPALAMRNFVGNGSSALMRKSAILEAGGYDPSLRARNGEGCEDWKLYFQIAERHRFAVISDFLTGYRRTDGNMSSNDLRMLYSRELCWAEFSQRRPEFQQAFRVGRNKLMRDTLRAILRRRQWAATGPLLVKMAAHDPIFLAGALAALPGWMAMGLVRTVVQTVSKPWRRKPVHFLN